MDIPGRRTQVTQASAVTDKDTVVIIQNGVPRNLPLSHLMDLGRSGHSGFSGFSGARGINGDYAASGFSGHSGFSGLNGLNGKSEFINVPPTCLIHIDEGGECTGNSNITTDGKTLFLSTNEGPQLVVQKDKIGKSIQVTANETDCNIAFHSQPYCSTFIGNGMPGESQGDDLVISASTYGVGLKEIARLDNKNLTLKLSRNLTIAQSSEFAGLSIPVGNRPEIRNDGDIWREPDGLYVQIGTTPVGPLSSMNAATPWRKVQAEIFDNGQPRILGKCDTCDLFYRRVGDSMECRLDVRQVKGVESPDTGKGSDYCIRVPSDLSIDEDKINFMPAASLMTIGTGILYDFAPNVIGFQPRDTKNIGVVVNNTSWNSNNHNLSNNTFNMCGTFTLPIKEWK